LRQIQVTVPQSLDTRIAPPRVAGHSLIVGDIHIRAGIDEETRDLE
jgi:hypothetical protein